MTRQEAFDEGMERTIRHYSPEEDDLIYENFWKASERQKIADQLDRPMRGITYRFYQLLKMRNMTPQEYLKLKDPERAALIKVPRGRPRGSRKTIPQRKWNWTDELDIKLWKMHRGGQNPRYIAETLGCPSENLCIERLNYLAALNESVKDDLRETPKSYPDMPADVEIASEISESVHDAGTAAGLAVISSVLPPVQTPDVPDPVIFKTVRENSGSDDLIESLAFFPKRAQDIENRLDSIENQLGELKERNGVTLRDVIAGLVKIDEATAERNSLISKYEALKADYQKLLQTTDKERESLQKEREELKKVYNDLEGVLHTFMNLSSVDKLRVLGDFSTQLVATVDKFGNVVQTRTVLG